MYIALAKVRGLKTHEIVMIQEIVMNKRNSAGNGDNSQNTISLIFKPL